MDQRLPKYERLRGKKQLDRLFSEGKSFFLSPFRVLYLTEDDGDEGRPPVRMAVAVPRRLFKKAVKRNLVKRRIREAYRRNKILLAGPLDENRKKMDVVFIYAVPEILSYQEIEEKIVLSLHKILKEDEKAPH